MFTQRFLFSLLFVLFFIGANANVNADSLLKAAANCHGALSDTAVIDLMNDLSVKFRKKGKYDTAYILASKAKELAMVFAKSPEKKVSNKAKKEVSYAFISIGNIYLDQGKYPEALNLYFKAMELKEEIADITGLAACLNNIGNIFDNMENLPEAIKYYEQAKKINEEHGNKNFLSKNLNNIGGIYKKLKKYDEALENYNASMILKEETKDQLGVALLLNNIGDIHLIRGHYEEAVKNYSMALEIQTKRSDKKGMSSTLNNLAEAYLNHHQTVKSRVALEEALKMAAPLGLKEELRSSYQILAVVDSLDKDFRSSNLHYHLYVAYRDSLLSEAASKKVLEQKMQFEFDKKEALSRLEEQQRNNLMQEEFKRQKQIRNIFLGGFILVLLMAAYTFYAYIQKRKNNKLLEAKNLIIGQKQKEILDSIHYASRIQNSYLPGEKYIDKTIRELKSRREKSS